MLGSLESILYSFICFFETRNCVILRSFTSQIPEVSPWRHISIWSDKVRQNQCRIFWYLLLKIIFDQKSSYMYVFTPYKARLGTRRRHQPYTTVLYSKPIKHEICTDQKPLTHWIGVQSGRRRKTGLYHVVFQKPHDIAGFKFLTTNHQVQVMEKQNNQIKSARKWFCGVAKFIKNICQNPELKTPQGLESCTWVILKFSKTPDSIQKNGLCWFVLIINHGTFNVLLQVAGICIS